MSKNFYFTDVDLLQVQKSDSGDVSWVVEGKL
jgi:hypothetical protein